MKTRWTLALLTTLLLAAPSVALAEDYWLHVSVDDQGDEEQVRINLPIELIESVMPLIEEEGFRGGHVALGRHSLHGDLDLVALVKAVRDARDGEYITVRDDEEHVRVAKEKGFFVIHAVEPDETVEVRMPISVIEALVSSGDRGELDVAAAVRVLAEQGGGDIVTVRGEDEHVRIWVDRSSSCE